MADELGDAAVHVGSSSVAAAVAEEQPTLGVLRQAGHSSMKRDRPGLVTSIGEGRGMRSLYLEYINPGACEYFAGLAGADRVVSETGASMRDELYMLMTRARICERAGLGKGDMILVVYGECKLAAAVDMDLRLYSGLANTEELHAIHPAFKSMSAHMSSFDSSKSAFVLSRVLKQVVRLDLPMVDIDQSKSLLRSVLSRFEEALQLHAHRELLDTFDAVIEDSGCSKDDSKDLWNGLLNGGGHMHVSEWERRCLASAPALAGRIMDETRRVIKHEVDANPLTIAAIDALKKGSNHELTLHTTLFQVDERVTAKIVQAAIEGKEGAAHMGFECDGDVFYRTGEPSDVSLSGWRHRVLGKGRAAHTHLAIKPYKSKEELLVELETSYPEADWRLWEGDWRERTVAKLELIARLVAGESGMDMLLKPLVPYRILRLCGADYLLKDIYKAAPGGRELDVLAFNVKFGRWELSSPPIRACGLFFLPCGCVPQKNKNEAPAWGPAARRRCFRWRFRKIKVCFL